MTPYTVIAATSVSDPEDTTAVILVHAQITAGMSIAQARELSLALARAADEAESRLPE